MQADRQKRIQLLVRENQGKKLRPAYLEGLSDATLTTVTEGMVKGLPETDRLSFRLRDEYKRVGQSGFHMVVRQHTSQDLYRLLSRLGGKVKGSVYLILTKAEDCGAVQLPAQAAILHLRELLEFDGDHVGVLDVREGQGLYLDRFEENSESWLELHCWGNEWVKGLSE